MTDDRKRGDPGGEHFHMEKWEIEILAEKSAEKAIRETFRLLGCDIDNTESVNSLRADLVHAHATRRMGESAKQWTMRAVLIAIVGGIIAAVAAQFPRPN